MAEEIFDVLIIGSGPAGLTAGIYCGRANLKVLILGGYKWGGQLMLTTEVENFPGFPKGIMGPELMTAMREQSERFGSKVVEVDVEKVEFGKKPFEITANGKVYMGKSVIVATGAENVWLGLPSEMKLIGRGVSSCAPCDAPFFRNKKVVVVGGGDAAMEEALVLSKFASSVVVVHRRDSFRASKVMQDRVFADKKIEVMWNQEVVEIKGDEKVEGVKLKNTQDGKEIEMVVDGVFVAIGHKPMTSVFEKNLDLDEKGFVKKGFGSMTSVEGVFVSGDVHDHAYKQAVTAAGYGCMAAMDVEKWLEGNS